MDWLASAIRFRPAPLAQLASVAHSRTGDARTADGLGKGAPSVRFRPTCGRQRPCCLLPRHRPNLSDLPAQHRDPQYWRHRLCSEVLHPGVVGCGSAVPNKRGRAHEGHVNVASLTNWGVEPSRLAAASAVGRTSCRIAGAGIELMAAS